MMRYVLPALLHHSSPPLLLNHGSTVVELCVNDLCPFQNTKHYELLNYSEHGTTVDNVLYSCDFSEKASPSPPSGLVAKVQGVIREYITVVHSSQCLQFGGSSVTHV